MNSARVPRALLARYSRPIPRYTSYPTAPSWQDDLPAEVARAQLDRAAADPGPLSLYAHLPFCKKLCFYCGCNMMVTRSSTLVERYLAALLEEVRQAGERFAGRRQVVQLHWGGGTPTHLSVEQLGKLHGALQQAFPFAPDAEQSIEVHPPVTTVEQVQALAAMGFNRVSMGVQDFDPVVQKAVNRPQPFEQTRDLIAACRQAGFCSVNVDLKYGLPHQNLERFARTLELVGQLRPERVALFGYAHLPALKPHQKLMPEAALPAPEQRLELFELAADTLAEQGYHYLGLDHFALKGDELQVAQEQRTLRRNFMGYTTKAGSDMLAFGSSAISDLGPAFLQNAREVAGYISRVEGGQLAIDRGCLLTPDDLIRQAVIHDLFCVLELDPARLSERLGIHFQSYFASELERLRPLAADGLVELAPDRIRVTPTGQVLLRNVAAVFDAHLGQPALKAVQFSQAV